MNRARTLAKAACAAAVIAAVTVALPFFLVLAVGWPLPHAVPSATTVMRAVHSGDVDQRVWLQVMAAVLWVAWAAFTTSVLLETIATLRGRATRPVSGLGWAQGIAAELVTGIVVVATLTATRTPPVQALPPTTRAVRTATPTASSQFVEGDRRPPALVRSPGPAKQWNVARLDTLWGIAHAALGDGRRAAEIVAANRYRTQPDGQHLTSITQPLRPGWTLDLPADATITTQTPPSSDVPGASTWTVQPADNFWTIAQRTLATHLGRAPTKPEIDSYWRQLIDANTSRLVHPGDPSLIYPGQPLTLPFLADQPAATPQATTPNGQSAATPRPPASGDGAPAPTPLPQTKGGPRTAPRPPAPTGPAEPGPAMPVTPAAPPNTQRPATSDPTPPTATAPTPPSATPPHSGSPIPRPKPPPTRSQDGASRNAGDTPARAQSPTREAPTTNVSNNGAATAPLPPPDPPRPDPAPATEPPPETTPADARRHDTPERPLRLPAELLGAGLATAGVVRALRGARRAQQRRRQTGHLIAMPDPAGRAAESALRAGTDLQQDDLVAAALAALSNAEPVIEAPALLRVTPTEITATFGVAPTFPPPPPWQACGEGWAVDTDAALAGASAGGVCPLMAPAILGTNDDTQLAVDLLAAPVVTIDGDPHAAAGLATAIAWNTATTCWAGPIDVVTCGLGPSAPNTPGAQSATTDEALDLAMQRAEQAAADLATTGQRTPNAAQHSGTGGFWTPLVVITTEHLSHANVEQVRHLAKRQNSCVAVVAVTPPIDDGWSVVIDDAQHACLNPFGLTFNPTCFGPPTGAALHGLIDTATNTPSTPATPVIYAAVAAPLDEPRWLYQARVLGDVDVIARHGQPVRFPRARAEELVVYLATNNHHVTLRDLDGDLWPDADTLKNRNNALSEARRTLGNHTDGTPILRPVAGNRVELSGAVDTDWAHFQRLATWGTRHDDDAGIDALSRALELVRDVPFATSRGRLNWVAVHEQQMISAIADTAETLAGRLLDRGRPAEAEHAARAGLLAAHGDERLYRVLIRAADQAGQPAKVRAAIDQLHHVIEAEVEPYGMLSQESRELIARIRRSPASVVAVDTPAALGAREEGIGSRPFR
jgi:DNA-binding SARP family transcriptional activator